MSEAIVGLMCFGGGIIAGAFLMYVYCLHQDWQGADDEDR